LTKEEIYARPWVEIFHICDEIDQYHKYLAIRAVYLISYISAEMGQVLHSTEHTSNFHKQLVRPTRPVACYAVYTVIDNVPCCS